MNKQEHINDRIEFNIMMRDTLFESFQKINEFWVKKEDSTDEQVGKYLQIHSLFENLILDHQKEINRLKSMNYE